MTYKERYGAWAGRPEGASPDFSRCCEEIQSSHGGWPHFSQCACKRGHGPDEAYCRQHDPVAVEARRAKVRSAARDRFNKERYRFHGRSFYAVLKQIAKGHNDARGLAQATIDEFDEGRLK